MKVIFAGHVGPPVGGLSTYCEDLLYSSLRERTELIFVETSQGHMGFDKRGRWYPQNFFNAYSNILFFARKLWEVNPDLVHITTVYNPSFLKHAAMVFIARMLGTKVIIQPHCAYDKIFQPGAHAQNAFARSVFSACHGILVISPEWQALEKTIGKKVSYVPNGINLNAYLSIDRCTEPEDDVFKILFLGHIGQDKGTFDLVQAAKILKEKKKKFFIRCFGSSILKGDFEAVQEFIKNSQLEDVIGVFPQVRDDEKVRQLAATNALVLPSYHEGMPISIIEAMAAGLPIVATKVGGIPELVKNNNNGLLIEPADVTGLANSLDTLMNDPALVKRMGNASREFAKDNYNIERCAKQIFQLYEAIA